MATVPSYLIPAGLRATSHVSKRKRRKQQRKHAPARAGGKKKSEDPLQSFAFTADKLDGSTDGKVVKRDPDAPVYALGRSTAGRNKWKMKHKKGQWKGKARAKAKAADGPSKARKRPKLPGDA